MIDQTFWEAKYRDGTILREADGVRYADLPSEELYEFYLVHGGLAVFGTRAPHGADGRNLRYRRTTEITQEGGRTTMFRIGWEPYGPAFLLDLTALDQNRDGLWISDQGFHTEAECRCVAPHPVGWFNPPVPLGSEV